MSRPIAFATEAGRQAVAGCRLALARLFVAMDVCRSVTLGGGAAGEYTIRRVR